MNANKAFSGSFFKATDLEAGKDVVLTIATVVMESVGDDERLVISFTDSDQKLPLNKTNGAILIELYGDETDDWEGKKIAIYRTKVDFQGKRVDALRIRDTKPGTAGSTGAAAAPAATTDPVAILAWAKAAAKAGGAHADELTHYAANAGALAIGAGVPDDPIDNAATPIDQITAIAAAMKAVIQTRAAVANQPEKIQF
jgi:hypothetical protein